MSIIQKLRNRWQEKAQLAEERKRAALARQRSEYQARKGLIDSYIKKRSDENWDEEWEKYQSRLKRAKEADSVCPRCGSKNVISVVHRIKGEIDGKISGEGSYRGGLLFSYGSSHTSGELHGELDTHEILKCKDCENEWKKTEVTSPEYHSIFSPWDNYRPGYFTRRILEYFKLKYDPKNLEETTFSLEEKRKKFLEKTREGVKWYWGVPIEVLEYTVARELIHDSEDGEEEYLNFYPSHREDPYLYRFPKRVREIVEYLTKEDEG